MGSLGEISGEDLLGSFGEAGMMATRCRVMCRSASWRVHKGDLGGGGSDVSQVLVLWDLRWGGVVV